jgi:hypothetical protein
MASSLVVKRFMGGLGGKTKEGAGMASSGLAAASWFISLRGEVRGLSIPSRRKTSGMRWQQRRRLEHGR